MTNKLENIKAEEMKLNADGELELSEELQDVVSGGVSPEDAEEEGNNGCVNVGCSANQN